MIRVARVLYPTDFSPYSNLAYFHAVALAEAHGATLTVVHVRTPDASADRAALQALLEQVRPANPRIPVSHVLLEGDPAGEISRFAADAGIDVVVIGTHGRTAAERPVMGSVAEQVFRESACSVLVVKLPKGAAGPAAPATVPAAVPA